MRKSLPVSHGVDDVKVSVDSGVDTLLPLTVDKASVAASVRVESLRVFHRLAAAFALVTDALGAVGLAVRDSCSAIVHERVRGQHGFDLPVAIGAVEKLRFKVTMSWHVLLDDENAALVSHVTR